jgi:hypothetical protein
MVRELRRLFAPRRRSSRVQQATRIEVRMSGRRNYHRYGVANAGGSLRVVRDVVVQPGAGNEFVVISDEPAAIGDLLTLERMVDGFHTSIEVAVVDSRPAIVNGSMRHRVRLKPTGTKQVQTRRAKRAH